MTIQELQRIVVRLSNQCYCRWWIHWNYPEVSPWQMAIELTDGKGHPVYSADLVKQGFEWLRVGTMRDGDRAVHVIERTNDDGSPWQPGEMVADAVKV